MRLFVYEFVTGGGWWSCDDRNPPSGSLLREGSSMLRALASDFARIADVRTLQDVRCPLRMDRVDVRLVANADDEHRQFVECVQQADACIVIAPEFDGYLLTRCKWVEDAGGRLLSPNSAFVELAADKHRTANRLATAGIRVPHGCLLSDRSTGPRGVSFPAVLKPVDGAGSLGVRMVMDEMQLREVVEPGRQYRLEEFHPGQAASVSLLSGPGKCLVLPASSQILSDDGRFRYCGGRTPLSPDLCRRAEVLARKVAAAMPSTVGYFGIDLVLGDQQDGSQDVVIEVNPRLTTSYLGLRKIARGNLAEAMWLTACGEQVDLSFATGPVQFAADDASWK